MNRMAEKKDPCRFTVMFNRTDPNHLQVVEVLNQQKHRKAQFIVNAVLHYLNCPETPVIQESVPVDKQAILNIVAQYLKEREYSGTRVQLTQAQPAASQPRKTDQCVQIRMEGTVLDDAEALLGADGLAAIADTMSAFRKG